VGRAARGGVLFRNATVLEAAAGVDTVVFDKTGTLTEGRPSVTDLHPVPRVSEQELLHLAAAADAQSEHPLATAIVATARERGFTVDPTSDFEAIPGHGVKASVHGRIVLVGNRGLLERFSVPAGLDAEAERLRTDANTALYVAADGRMMGLIAVADAIRPTTRAAVAALHHLGVRVLLLTGDSRPTAEAVGGGFRWDRDRDGDGRRHRNGGVILMKDDPSDVAAALTLARRVHRKIVQNLFWAAIYNVVAIPLAAGALYPSLGILLKPAWAALAMSASTVTVTVNALLLRRLDGAGSR
jgi:Cu2+-exporting ATPase